ncbi:unnamed protein product [Larinioides sclopetarius]|uniref:Uncharacterized protein n=1 Tax=Larinioides sclopetarius TaxID=280406 RepID=A0AAV2B2B8_9ARAC
MNCSWSTVLNPFVHKTSHTLQLLQNSRTCYAFQVKTTELRIYNKRLMNMMRALWDFAIYCWRTFRVFWTRLTSSQRAPTVQNIVAYQNQPIGSANELRRQYSLRAHQGSVSSSMHDSTISDRSPTDFSIPETASQTSRISVPSSGEQNEPVSEKMRRNVQRALARHSSS